MPSAYGRHAISASESWRSSVAICARSCARAGGASPRAPAAGSAVRPGRGRRGRPSPAGVYACERVDARPERLLDVDLRDARDAARRRRAAGASGRPARRRRRPRRGAPRPGRRASATTSRPGGQVAARARPPPAARRSARHGRRAGRRARSASSAQSGTPVSSAPTSSASSTRPARAKAAVHEALDDDGLDRRAVDVGVEADVAREGAVGGGHGLAAHRHRPRARRSGRPGRAGAPRSHPGLRAPAGAGACAQASPSPGSSRATVVVDPPGVDRRVARAGGRQPRRAGGALERGEPGARGSRAVELADGRRRHPAAGQGERQLRADRDAVEVREDAVAVVADREAPAVAAHERAQLAAVAADRDGGELHAGVARRGRARARRARPVQRAPRVARKREDDRPALPQLADVEDARAAHVARRARRPRRPGPLRRATLTSPSSAPSASGAANGGIRVAGAHARRAGAVAAQRC